MAAILTSDDSGVRSYLSTPTRTRQGVCPWQSHETEAPPKADNRRAIRPSIPSPSERLPPPCRCSPPAQSATPHSMPQHVPSPNSATTDAPLQAQNYALPFTRVVLATGLGQRPLTRLLVIAKLAPRTHPHPRLRRRPDALRPNRRGDRRSQAGIARLLAFASEAAALAGEREVEAKPPEPGAGEPVQRRDARRQVAAGRGEGGWPGGDGLLLNGRYGLRGDGALLALALFRCFGGPDTGALSERAFRRCPPRDPRPA